MSSREFAELRHSLRTPINHIIGYTELLVEEDNLPENSNERLARIQSAAQQILAIVQKHLQAAEPDAANTDLNALRRDLREPLDQVIDSARELENAVSGSRTKDVQRIVMAAEELRRFVEGDILETAPLEHRFAPSMHRELQIRGDAKFLVVDDSDPSREVLCRLLERQKSRCVAVGGGIEALELLQSEKFDVVLLDLMMPGMTGLDVLRAMKQNPDLADVPVVMLSAFDEVDEIGHCLEMGAEDYLLKPVDRTILNARLNAILDRKRLQTLERRRTLQLEIAESELRRSNEELRRFASVVSHDLQEPLRMVTTYMELLKRDLGENLTEKQRDFLGFAIDGGRRMSDLIQDLLAYSRVSAGDPRVEKVDCSRVLNEVIGTLKATMDETGAQIVSGPLPEVDADCSQIRQLFQNLLSNAMKYRSERPPRVEVAAVAEADHWRFSFKDNGIGIRQEDRERIFEMFRRLHGRTIPGTGIGLAICQRVVERLGGQIWVDSIPGEGSTFHFTIPF